MREQIIKKKPKYLLAVVFIVSFLTMIGTFSSANAASLNVDDHSKAEIINRIKTNPVSVYNMHTFATEPRKNDIRGELSDSSKQDALKMFNNIRYVAGLNDVVLDGNCGGLSQAAAFVNWAIGELTHYPGKKYYKDEYGNTQQVDRDKPEGMSDADWEDGKTGAAQTNIAYNYDTLNAAVLGWTEDDDERNIEMIGHRRWTLNPKMGKVGFGAAGPYYAEYSFDKSGNGTQTNVAWPARFMPVQYFGKNIPWSLSIGSTVNKNNVQVVLERSSDSPSGYQRWEFNGAQTYTPANTGEYFNVNNQGYGQTGCIIFRPNGINEYKAGDKFDVRITDAGSEEIAYSVEFFDPYLVSDMRFSKETYTMNGSTMEVEPSVLPKEARSYQVSYSSSNEDVATVDESGVVTKVGMGETIITATISGEYTENGSPLSASYTLKVPKKITDDDVTKEIEQRVDYTGEKAKPKVTITHNGKELEEGKDYDVKIPDDAILPKMNGNTYYAYYGNIIGKGDYTGDYSFLFWIYKKDLSSCDIVLEPSKTEYSGALQKPTVKVLNGDVVMLEGSDYVITKNDGGTNVGRYTVSVSAAPESKGYQGNTTTTFEITKKNLTEDMVEDISDETFNGSAHNPEPVVKNGNQTLIKDKDYTLSYENNINAGIAKVTITGKGNYKGTVTKEFTIKGGLVADDPTDDPTGGKTNDKPEQPGQTPGNTPDPGSGSEAQPTNQKGADGTALGQGASAQAAEAAIMGMKSDNDPAGSAFGKLQMRSQKQTKNSIKLAWKKVSGAVKYIIYGNKCGIKNKMKKITEVSSASFNVKKIEDKGLKKGTSYKFILVAIDGSNKVVSSSKVIHVFTAGGKVGNHKKVIVKAKVGKKVKAVKKVTVKVRKKVKLKTQLVSVKKKLKIKKHVAVRFESDNTKIATVSKAGVVKGLKKGKCTIYAYAQNGVFAKVKVTVK